MACSRRQVDLNATEADGFTALHWAAQRDDLQLVDLLVSAGANAKASSRYNVYAALSRRHERQRRDHRAPVERWRRPERRSRRKGRRC